MEPTKNRSDLIRLALASLQPTHLVLHDQSAAHQGHAGAKSGGGHFTLEIVSAAFEGKSLIQRHQIIYTALGDLMKTDIHALSIKAKTPAES